MIRCSVSNGISALPGKPGFVPGVDLDVILVWPNYTGKGVKVAIIDSGVQYTHPDLARNYDLSVDFNPLTLEDTGYPARLDPSDNHGTSVAGIVAAQQGNGMEFRGSRPMRQSRRFLLEVFTFCPCFRRT